VTKHPQSQEDLAGLYRAAIRQHASAPVGYRKPIDATHRHEEYNPLCGDRIQMHLRVVEDIIEAAAFDGEGCAICMASASLLCSLSPGQTVAALKQMGEDLQQALNSPSNVEPTVGAASAAMKLNNGKKTSRLKPLLQPLPRDETDDAGLPERLRALLGVRPYPSRIRCATLPWTAARRALTNPEPITS